MPINANRNIFLFLFYLSFIDFFLFSIVRILIEFNFVDLEIYKMYRSDFKWFEYSVSFLFSLMVFLFTIILVSISPKDSFKIYISKKIFVILSFILLASAVFIYFEQLNYLIRYTSGSINTIHGINNIFYRILLLSLFFIYQLNREKLNFKIYTLLLISSFLTIDGLGGFLTFFSLLLFEFFRFRIKYRITYFIFFFVSTLLALELTFQIVFKNKPNISSIYDISNNLKYFFVDLLLPRYSIQGEQLFSYISQDLDISNYNYLLKIIPESFKNILKVIFYNGEDIYYPKSVAQSIAFNIVGEEARGGSSPGFVLSNITFFPFTLPLSIFVALLIKQFFYRFNEKINIIQVICIAFITKAVTANLLGMFLIITPSFALLFSLFLSSHIYFKTK